MQEVSALDIPRGVAPQILLSQVRNTVPYVFEDSATSFDQTPYLFTLRKSSKQNEQELSQLSHFDYFKLCVSAHFGTVSSFVPTDVDNQIRFRLWHPGLELKTIQEMAQLVLDSRNWDMTAVSERYVRGPASGRILSGLHGEWFSIAAAAYGATRKKDQTLSLALLEAIQEEIKKHAEVVCELTLHRDGIGLLKAVSTVAHNLGDLDRVIDQWSLETDDPLRQCGYKAGHNESQHPWLLAAGNLYKMNIGFTAMADENHRHFALRAAKCLRRSRDLLLPIAPFYDDWGSKLGRHPALSPEEIAEVVECLMDGWERLKPIGRTQTYPRALSGIESTFPGGLSRLCQYLPARAAKNLRSGSLRTFCSTARSKFEEQLGSLALQKMKGLPPC